MGGSWELTEGICAALGDQHGGAPWPGDFYWQASLLTPDFEGRQGRREDQVRVGQGGEGGEVMS